MTSRRNTIQKDLVRNTVYEMRRHVTVNLWIMIFHLKAFARNAGRR